MVHINTILAQASLSYDLYSVLDSHKAYNKQHKNTISALLFYRRSQQSMGIWLKIHTACTGTPGVRTLINLLWLSDILTSRHTRITLLLKISLLAAFAPRLTAFKVAYTRVYAKQFYVDPNTIKFEIKNQGLFKDPPPPTLPKIQGLLKTVRTVNRHNWELQARAICRTNC